MLWQLSKDVMEDEDEEVTYSWVREYHWDVCDINLIILYIFKSRWSAFDKSGFVLSDSSRSIFEGA